MSIPFVYLAGPIVHLTQSEAQGWREEFAMMVTDYDVHCLSPVRGKNLKGSMYSYGPDCSIATGTPRDLFTSPVITTRDLFDLGRSSAMVLHFPNPSRKPVGSMIELGFAYARQIPVILWSQPSDLTAHPMVSHMKYRLTHSMPETVVALVDLLGLGGLH